MPLISVIVPAYNAEKTILETIQSIQKQTFSDFELIVINDGSTDKTLDLLSTIKDPRLKVFSYENGGLPVARNRGISRATGEYITFVDADDLWTPDKLELQLAALQQHPEAGVAYSWTAFIDEEGKYLYAWPPTFYEGNVYPQMLTSNFIANGSNILVRRQFVELAGEFDPILKSVEDWDYYIRLAALCSFVAVPKYQILYRRSSQSMTSKVDVMEKYNLIVIERAFQAAPPELQFLKNPTLSNTYLFLTQLCLAHVLDKEGVKKAVQKIQRAIQLNPKIVLKSNTLRLMLKVGLLRFLPYKAGLSLTEFLGKLFSASSNQSSQLVRQDLSQFSELVSFSSN